jgi:hypothetical protein
MITLARPAPGVQVVASGLAHAAELAANLRPADRAEIDAATGREPRLVIADGIKRSLYSRALFCAGRLAMMWGVCPMVGVPSVGIPWALGTPVIDRHRRHLMRVGRDELQTMLAVYPVLTNVVHAVNDRAVRWLGWLGAEFSPAQPLGPRGEDFFPFAFRRKEG